MGLVAFFVAATVVTLLQLLRLRDRRALPLLAMFALLALGHFRGAGDGWGRLFHFGAGAAGLAALVAVSPRHVAR
ncbi:MAG TPA: hypothetical protein VIG50_17375 [Vicinamibacteria bacterium]|jgi:hypothetical protein